MKNLIWADRIALVWWIFLAIVMQLVWKDPHSSPFSDPGVWYIFELIVGIPWLILRAIDLMITGQIRLVGWRVTEQARLRRQQRDKVAMVQPLDRPLATPSNESGVPAPSDYLQVARRYREARRQLHLPPHPSGPRPRGPDGHLLL